MSRRMIISLCGISLLTALPAVSQTPKAPMDAISSSEPRHVILIIGDGMDDQQITIARNYLAGATGRLELDKLPLRSTSQILTTQDNEDGKPVYVADSANTATSMATGKVTSRGRISTTAGSDLDIPTIVELASAAGFKTGIVTTASVTDATPSAFVAHISYRLCENPELILDITYSGIHLGECKADLKSNGGKGSIAEQLADSSLDVLLGGGSKHFALNAENTSTTVLEIAQNNGFNTVATATQMAGANADNRLLGLFAPSTMPVKLRGEDGRVAESPEPSILNRVHEYLGDVTQPALMRCEPNPEFASVPTLKDELVA